MTRGAYYNEIDPYAAHWLRNLITAGFIAPGDVDERDIRDVCPDDLKPYTQCHFFAGIGVWSHALRSAGWQDDRPVWTGSCPCQPFSSAGRRGGVADERHLWPHWHHLIAERRPGVVFGEQVASKDGRAWFDLVSSDLEGLDYAAGAFDLCAAGFGAPHIRQRLYFVGMADAASERLDRRESAAWTRRWDGVENCGSPERMADADGRNAGAEREQRGGQYGQQPQDRRASERMADDVMSERPRSERDARHDDEEPGRREGATAASGHDADHRPGPTNGFWRDADWLGCRDEKWRPVEPGSFPLANGAPARVGRLRAYGNAIVAPQAEAFVSVVMEHLS